MIRVYLKLLICGSMFLPVLLCYGQSVRQEGNTAITGQIYTGEIKTPKPATAKQKPSMTVRSTVRQHVSGRTVTLHEVDPPVIVSNPAVEVLPKAPLTENPAERVAKKEAQQTQFIFVNAHIYDEGVTQLTVWCDGQQAVCWTKINARYLQCFDQFKAEGRPYYMLSTVLAAENPSNAHKEGYPETAFKRRGGEKPYIVTESNPTDRKATRIIQDIHKLYQAEETRLQTAYSKHLQNTALRAAKPLAPPPPPKPVTIRFWKRDVEQERRNAQAEGGQRR